MELTQSKLNEAKIELKEWLEKPDTKNFYFLDCKNNIEENLKEEVLRKSTLVDFETIDNWYTNNFVFEMLTTEQSNFRQEMTSNGFHILILANKFAEIYPNKPPELLFDKTAFWLSNCLIQKLHTESETLIKIINNGLSTDMLDGGWEIKPFSWFIIEIANKGYGINSDLSKYNYPDNMGVYRKAIDNWDTKDFGLLDNIVSELCDFHLENATYGKVETTPDIQFGDMAWFVYGFEILTWLSIREKIGLRNLEKLTHPLMQLAINQLPKNPLPIVDDELFLKALEKLNN